MSWALTSVAAMLALSFLSRWWCGRTPNGFPSGPCIVVVEPSVFRGAETYVNGPFPSYRDAWTNAHRVVRCNPHAEARLLPASTTVWLGGVRLWPR